MVPTLLEIAQKLKSEPSVKLRMWTLTKSHPYCDPITNTGQKVCMDFMITSTLVCSLKTHFV